MWGYFDQQRPATQGGRLLNNVLHQAERLPLYPLHTPVYPDATPLHAVGVGSGMFGVEAHASCVYQDLVSGLQAQLVYKVF